MKTTSQNKYRNWVFTWNADPSGMLFQQDELEDFLKQEMELYVFQLEQGEEANRLHYQGCFRTKIRKRQSTLLKEFDEQFGTQTTYLTINRMCGTWDESYQYCTKDETRVKETAICQSVVLQEYEGKDLKLFEDEDNWHPWQRELYKKLFIQGSFNLSTPDDREIVWITDTAGGTGKSKFTKLLCTSNHDILKLPFGTASQLRSAVICAGRHSCYLIDIPRTLGEDDDIYSLISAVEDIKNGYVVSSMYGKYQSLLMEPPHIIVFSNNKAPVSTMTSNRWLLYVIEDLKLRSLGFDEPHPGNGFDSTYYNDIIDELEEMEELDGDNV